jgi:hypothetical protein
MPGQIGNRCYGHSETGSVAVSWISLQAHKNACSPLHQIGHFSNQTSLPGKNSSLVVGEERFAVVYRKQILPFLGGNSKLGVMDVSDSDIVAEAG